MAAFVPLTEIVKLVNLGTLFAFVPVNVGVVNLGTLFAFVLVNVGVVILRRTRPELKRGFRVRSCRCSRSSASCCASTS